ncbi:MAG TPA: right-handed parallel beta-helix repeat-containing protein, partial [Chitinophagaceae bacterium]
MKTNITYRKILKKAFLNLFFVLIFMCIGRGYAQNVDNQTKSTSFLTIQAAIDDANTTNGDILFVHPGLYLENVNVYKQLTIRGNNFGVPGNSLSRAPESTVDGNFVSAPFALNNNNITLDGLEIIHGHNGLNAGVWMNASFGNMNTINCIIRNNAIGIYANCATPSLIQNNLFNVNNNLPAAAGGSAIYSEFTIGLTVNKNEFENHTENNPVIFGATGPGVHMNLKFTRNNLHDNTFGTYFISVTNGTITNNTFNVPNATGISFGGADKNISVSNNFFTSDPAKDARGVRVRDDGYGYGDNSSITINNNSFTNIFSDYYIGIESGYSNPPLDATCNWYSTTDETTIASKITGSVTFKPYLVNGTDDKPSLAGFQPKPNSCTGPVVCNLHGGNITMTPNRPVKGQAVHTIYLGYGPQCATLKAPAVSGGTPPYTYLWSTSATTSSIHVCPTTNTTYTLTITDYNGCTLQKSFTVYVVDVRCGPYNDKVLVCHYGETKCVTKNQAKNFINNGDKLGPCSMLVSSGESQMEKISSGSIKVSAYPNPFTTSTKIVYRLPYDSKVSLKVYDAMGKEVATIAEG